MKNVRLVSSRRVLALFGLVVVTVAVHAKTVYVSQQTGSNSNNGLSENTPKATIQNAINAAANGDTILVGPGVYADDEGLQNSGHWWGQSRIMVNSKALCIKSTHGPDVTHIVGKRGNTTTGYSAEEKTTYGTDVAKCVIVMNATTNKPVIIQGFTLRGGSTHDRWNAPSGRGGALMDSSDGAASSKSTYVVDCVISNCQGAATQIAVGGTFVRCRIQDNTFVSCYTGPEGNAWQSVYVYSGGSRFLNCLFWHNRTIKQSGETQNDATYWTSNGRFVNCTIAANRANFYSHATAYFYNNIYSLSLMRTDDGSSRVNQINDNSSTRMMMAPTLGDIRLREGTVAVTAGDPQYVGSDEIIPMPEVDRLGLSEDFRIDPYIDLYGNPIPKTGTIACGAVQQTAVPAAGALVAYNEQVIFQGMSEPNRTGLAAWMWPSNYPTSIKIGIAPSEGEAFHSFSLSSHGTGMGNLRFPLWNEDATWFIPPPSTNVAMTVSYTRTQNFKWVDSSNADDPAQDGSEDHPYAVIQDAVNALGDNVVDTLGVIFVKPGVYSTGGENNSFSSDSGTVYARVRLGSRRVRLVSTDGPEKTVILGARDPASADGCGANAYMTVSMNAQAAVQGFTLTGGYSGVGALVGSGRGALYSYGRDLHVTDCIITNNTGRNCAIGTARFARCLITGNTGGNGLSYAGMFISCLVGGNTITGDTGFVFDDGGQDFPFYLLNTTAVCDGFHNAFGMLSVNSRRFNSVVCRGGRMRRPSDSNQNGMTAGCLYNGFFEYLGNGYTVGDPMLRNAMSAAAEPDFSLYLHSPAFGVAVSPADDPAGIWWYLCTMDYHGNPWKFDSAGRPVAGALQEAFTGGAYVGDGNGGVSVMGGTVGYNDLVTGASLTVGLKAGGSRPIAGFVVNGATNLFAKGDATTITVTKEEGVDLTVEPIMTSNWYVDAVDGDDTSNGGYNPTFAFKTLARALTNEYLSASDTVKALPGTYDQGEMYQSTTALLPSRAVVPTGVTLESTDGAAATVIKGRAAEADAEIVPTNANYVPWAAGKGLGTNAVRCVFANSGATVRGFTLADGHTRGFTPAGANDHSSVDTCGGCMRGSGTAERCVFTNGVAFRGGGAYGSTCIDCIFDGNIGLYGGGATSDAYQYGCLTRNNVCYQNASWGGFFYWRVLEGCTVLDSFSGPSSRAYVMKNSLIIGKVGNWDWSPGPTNFVNCAVATDAGTLNALNYYGGHLATNGNSVATVGANLQVDEDGRPIVGANLAADAADAALSSKLADTDLSGRQRIYNGALDIGALEADWRGVYAADIGGQTMEVTEATPGVVESAAHTVLVNPEQSLAATWAGRPGRTTFFELPLRVTGSGTLTVTINGETRTYTAVDGKTVWRFGSALAENAVTALYDGEDGYGELLKGGRRLGMGIVFR